MRGHYFEIDVVVQARIGAHLKVVGWIRRLLRINLVKASVWRRGKRPRPSHSPRWLVRLGESVELWFLYRALKGSMNSHCSERLCKTGNFQELRNKTWGVSSEGQDNVTLERAGTSRSKSRLVNSFSPSGIVSRV